MKITPFDRHYRGEISSPKKSNYSGVNESTIVTTPCGCKGKYQYGELCAKHGVCCVSTTHHVLYALDFYYYPTTWIWSCEPISIEDIYNGRVHVFEFPQHYAYQEEMYSGADHCGHPAEIYSA